MMAAQKDKKLQKLLVLLNLRATLTVTTQIYEKCELSDYEQYLSYFSNAKFVINLPVAK